MLQPLCMPALIYLIYSLSHVIIDMYKEQYSKAMIEFWLSAIFTLLLNILCQQGLGIVSWFIVSIPFLLMTTIATLLLFAFKLNPATGEPLTQTTPPPDSPLQPSPYAYPIVVNYKNNHPSGYDRNDKYTTVPQQTQQTQQQTQQTQQQTQPQQSPELQKSLNYTVYMN